MSTLAIATTSSITLLESSVLKKSPSSINITSTLDFQPSTTCWSIDNSVLYLASANTIQALRNSSSSTAEVYSIEDGTITSLLAKDKSTLVFSVAENVHFLEGYATAAPKLSSMKYSSHKSPITSLSISNDSTLLLSTSTSSAHIHNLTLNGTNPTTILRGLPPSTMISAGIFHSHSRTRVLIGVGKQLLLYDTTKPAAPLKTFTIEGEGHVEMIACSPFSKTLVAVAMGGLGAGTVGLVDLEKEKGLFRAVNTKVPITALSFSPEGASIYAGTTTGRVMIIDLRSLDKPPAVTEIVGEGSVGPVVDICVQKKTTGATTISRKPSTPIVTSPGARRTVSASKPSTPTNKRVISTSRPGAATVAAVKMARSGAANAKKPEILGVKKVFSPIRSPLANSSNRKTTAKEDNESLVGGDDDISVKLETLGALRRNPTSPGKTLSTSTLRPRTVSTASRASVVSRATTKTTTTSPRLGSSRTTESISTRQARTKPGEGSSSVPPVPPLPKTIGDIVKPRSRAGSNAEKEKEKEKEKEHVRTRTRTRTRTKTPSPDLPSLGDVDPHSENEDAPLPMTPATKKKTVGFRALGLGTPGLPGKGKGKNVDSEDESSSGSEDEKRVDGHDEGDLSLQISPARRPSRVAASASENTNIFSAFPVSPPRPGQSPPQPQNLLRNIVHSVLSDFHLQTHREMTNLHLDLVRMGRGWRKDVREVVKEEMEDVMEGMMREMKETVVREIRDGMGSSSSSSWDVRELKEENRRLKEENEKLRRVGVTSTSAKVEV